VKVLHPTTLVCKDVVELTTELLGGTLEAVARAHIEQHLLVCPPCTIHLRQVRTTIALTRDLEVPAPAAAVSPALLDAFRKTRDGGG
jgi:predicted anti-sigma-YlaC factor YlaD